MQLHHSNTDVQHQGSHTGTISILFFMTCGNMYAGAFARLQGLKEAHNAQYTLNRKSEQQNHEE